MVAQRTGSECRVRNFHRKSRKGCGNCKMRRVKCDEVRPHCGKCQSYGVVCDYISGAKLHMAAEIQAPTPVVCDETTIIKLEPTHLQHLVFFKEGLTVWTIVNIPQLEVLKMAYSKPYLMHIVLAISAFHNRYQRQLSLEEPNPFEAYHAYKSAALLNEALSKSIKPEERDTLWMAATFLGVHAVLTPAGVTAQDAWPLVSHGDADLGWLRFAGSKMALWELTDPVRQDSIFQTMQGEYVQMFNSVAVSGADGISAHLALLCDLHENSTASNNPYFTAAHTLSLVLNGNAQLSRSRILAFTSQMGSGFKALLHAKDPVALLLLALWYEKAGPAVWWIQHRATVEHQAIYLYLYLHGSKLEKLLAEGISSWRSGERDLKRLIQG